MYTSNIFMNHCNDIRLSQTQQENSDKCEWMEHPTNEREWTLGNVEMLKTKYEKPKPTHKKQSYTDGLKQTFLGRVNSKDMPTFCRSQKDRISEWFPYLADETSPEWSKPYPKTNHYGTKLTNPCKSSGLRNHVGRLASYTDPRASRDGGRTKVSGMQNRKDELFSRTDKNKDGGGSNGGGKKGEETDNNDTDRSQRSPFEQTDIKNKFGSAAKDISQTVISDFVSKSLCSIIDSRREKGLQNTEFSKILTNAFCSSMHTFKNECLTQTTSLFLEWLPTAGTQLKCVEGPMQNFFLIWEIISIIKDFLEGRLTLRQLVKWLLNKLVSLGIL